MSYQTVAEKLKARNMNRNGFTFLMAIFMVMIVGILSAFTGKSWTMIMKREKEKELIFRGSQIKEAIENWNNLNYSVQGVKWTGPQAKPLMDLKELLENPHVPGLKYLPQSYGAKVDAKNPKCDPDCAEYKIYQDPMTGKEWTIIRGNIAPGKAVTAMGNQGAGQPVAVSSGTQGAPIIGVASKSDETPIKTDFMDTALENMGTAAVVTTPTAVGTVPPVMPAKVSSGETTPLPVLGGKMTKYSEWKFIADTANDHKKIYRAYHEGW